MQHRTVSWTGIGTALLLAGCAGASSPEDGTGAGSGELPDLPPYGGCWIASCGVEPSPAPFAAWAGRADAVVVGDVVEVASFFEPVAVNGDGEDLVTAAACVARGGFLVGGIRLVLERIDVLYGQAPARIEVDIGAGQVDMQWCVQPTPGRGLSWGDGRGLAVGQRLGILLAHDPLWDEWLSVQPLQFLVDADGVVRFREDLAHCGSEPPEGIDGAPLEELRQRLHAIDPADPALADGRAYRQRRFDPAEANARRAGLYLAHCGIELVQSGCTSDSDCDASSVCHPDGSCAPP